MSRQYVYDLVGESARNDDGTNRQAILRRLHPGLPVQLVRDRANKYDPNAILVKTYNGEGLGHIATTDNPDLAERLDAGATFVGHIHQLTGGVPGYPNFGCRIAIMPSGSALRHPLPLKPEQSLYNDAPKVRQ